MRGMSNAIIIKAVSSIQEVKYSWDILSTCTKGSSKNYVDKISLIFTIYLPIVDIRGHFANYPPFVHVDSDISEPFLLK